MKRNDKTPLCMLLVCLCALLLCAGLFACAVTPVPSGDPSGTEPTAPSVTPTTPSGAPTSPTTPTAPTTPTTPTNPTTPTTPTTAPTAPPTAEPTTTPTTRPGAETPEAYRIYRTLLENMSPTGVTTSASLACLSPAVTLTSETSVTRTADGKVVFAYAYDTLAPVGSGSASPVIRVSDTVTLDADGLDAATLSALGGAVVLGWLDFTYADIAYAGPVVGADGRHTVTMTVADGDADLLFGFETGYTGLVMTWVFDMEAGRPVSATLTTDAPAGRIQASATYSYT